MALGWDVRNREAEGGKARKERSAGLSDAVAIKRRISGPCKRKTSRPFQVGCDRPASMASSPASIASGEFGPKTLSPEAFSAMRLIVGAICCAFCNVSPI